MTGYHYTSYSNWLSIQASGFQPYQINKPELDEYFPAGVKGIWTWVERPSGKSELGSILFQTATKQSTHIVLLEFDYEPSDRLEWDGQLVTLPHDGMLGSWLYHQRQPAYVITVPIPPENIRLVKSVNLLDLVPPDLGVEVADETQATDRLG